MDKKDKNPDSKKNARRSGDDGLSTPGAQSSNDRRRSAIIDEKISGSGHDGTNQQPGAHAIGQNAASRLDERIATKQQQGSLDDSQPRSKESVPKRNEADRIHLDPESVAQVSQLETDASTKRTARKASPDAGHPVKEGASNENEGSEHQWKSLVASRRASRSPPPPSGGKNAPGARPQLQDMEDQVAAKTVANPSSLNGLEQNARAKARVAAKTAANPSSLNGLEQGARAKARTVTSTATAPGAYTQLESLETAVGDKVQNTTIVSNAQQTASRTKVQNSTMPSNGLQSAVRSSSSATTTTDLDRLDQRISAKVSSSSGPSATVGTSGSISRTVEINDDKNGRKNFDNPEMEDRPDYEDAKMDSIKSMENSFTISLRDAQDNAAASILKAAEANAEDKHQSSHPSVTGTDNAENPTLTAARGILNEPDVEFGTTGGDGGHGYVDEGLAIAVAVSNNEEEAFIPAAVQYDPDSKPPIYRNRRFRVWAVTALVLLVVIVVGVSLGVTQTKGPVAPTMAPTPVRMAIGIQEEIVTIVGERALNKDSSPFSKAMWWIMNEDPAELSADDDRLLQRYILALFHVYTTQEEPWLSCNKPTGNKTDQCLFQKPLDLWPEPSYQPMESFRWMSGVHECEWAGVYCDDFNQTRAIELVAQQIRGELPSALAELPYLQSINVVFNEFYGTLPSELGKMKHLLNIEMHFNSFTGGIPEEWYSAQALQRLNVGSNMLTGSISTEIGTLSTLKGLFLMDNMLTGTLPTEIGKMKFLSFTRNDANKFSGTLPTELGKLEKLQEMWLMRNGLTGSIPSEVGTMRDMTDMRIHNMALNGTIPDELYSLPQLRRFDIYDCNITGSISTEIGKATNLKSYRVRNNFLTGTIPTELAQLSKLEYLWLHTNDLTGTVPLELCARRGPDGLKFLSADCYSAEPGVEKFIDCPELCCNACCDRYIVLCIAPE